MVAPIGTHLLSTPVDLWPNNRFTGTFSCINPYGWRLFLLILSERVLSGVFSIIITSA
jgi:hypothetical protein